MALSRTVGTHQVPLHLTQGETDAHAQTDAEGSLGNARERITVSCCSRKRHLAPGSELRCLETPMWFPFLGSIL